MAREPRYPADAPIGDAETAAQAAKPIGDPAPVEAPDPARSEGKRAKQLATGAAIGIGSAAIVAALLYAKGRGKSEKR